MQIMQEMLPLKGNTKFRYGVMNLVQMNILKAYAILQCSMISVAVEIESKVDFNIMESHL